MSSPAALVVAVALLGGNAFFVAAEFAVLAARRARLEQLSATGDRRARAALAAVRQLSIMLAGAQLGITMASLGLGAVAEPALAHTLEDGLAQLGLHGPSGATIAFAVALTIVVFVHMVVGEMAPKSWAISHPEHAALRLARPFSVFVTAFRPLIRLLNASANGVVRLCRVEPRTELTATHSAGDLVLLLRESTDLGTLPRPHGELLTRGLELSGLDARSAMTPRQSVVTIPETATIAEMEDLAHETGRSRLVVRGTTIDDLRGVAHIRDALALDDHQRTTHRVAMLAEPPLVVDASTPLEDLLLDMQQRHRHLAVVVDQHRNTQGVITLEDVLEQLIGNFLDEHDQGPPH